MQSSSHQKRQKLLNKIKRIVIKIGSGILTDDKGLNTSFFKELASQVSKLQKDKYEVVIVTSGAVASGMSLLKLKNRPKAIPQKQAVAALGQPALMHLYSRYFQKLKMNVAQILLTRDDLQNRHRFLNAKNALREIFEFKMIPIVNENDSVVVEEMQVGDNDQLSAMVAHLVDADLLIILTDTDGFFDKDPKKFKGAKRIPFVENINEETLSSAEGTLSEKSVGGMLTKLKAAKQAASFGVPTWIVNGKNPKILKQVLKYEDVGTLFLPNPQALSSRKYWIAHTLQSKGEIVIDEGAYKAVKNQNKSLLPSGISEIRGQFMMGDAVTILSVDQEIIAKGLVNYSSQDLDKIKGVRSSEIKKILSHNGYDEVINRDDLVLL